MATTRLRKTFHYPSDSDSSPDELDEEHQERLIQELQTKDSQKSTLYRRTFLLIPLLSTLLPLSTLLAPTSSARERLIALLTLSSSVCTAYILHYMPIEAPERKGKRPVYQIEAEKGPVERYLVFLNGGLAGLLLLAAAVSWGRGLREDAWREVVPAVVFGLTMFARQQLAPLDLEELQKARYEYKGA